MELKLPSLSKFFENLASSSSELLHKIKSAFIVFMVTILVGNC